MDFQTLKFLTVTGLVRVEVRRHAKFGRRRSNRGGDMAISRLFKMAAAAILDCQNFKLLTFGRLKGVEVRRQIWSKSVKMRRKYNNFSIFEDGGRRHIGFLNFKLNDRTAQEGRNA